jgi:hypothetical protein
VNVVITQAYRVAPNTDLKVFRAALGCDPLTITALNATDIVGNKILHAVGFTIGNLSTFGRALNRPKLCQGASYFEHLLKERFPEEIQGK